MNRRLVSVLCFAGALAVSIGFAKDNDFQAVKTSAQSEVDPVKVHSGGDRSIVAPRISLKFN
ncbi:hypothetical protein FZC66_08880 [Priestia megaterium]|nr:hypothetical protein FZC66_08880 [Priestia megaterium]